MHALRAPCRAHFWPAIILSYLPMSLLNKLTLRYMSLVMEFADHNMVHAHARLFLISKPSGTQTARQAFRLLLIRPLFRLPHVRPSACASPATLMQGFGLWESMVYRHNKLNVHLPAGQLFGMPAALS